MIGLDTTILVRYPGQATELRELILAEAVLLRFALARLPVA